MASSGGLLLPLAENADMIAYRGASRKGAKTALCVSASRARARGFRRGLARPLARISRPVRIRGRAAVVAHISPETWRDIDNKTC